MADNQLRELADGHHDFVGAAITLREPAANRESSFLFEVTIAACTKPSNTAATGKQESASEAMQDALDAIKHQIRSRRDQQRQ
jgi:hypothetical protein